MEVRQIQGLKAMEALREEWTALWLSNPSHTPFQAWEWMMAWYTHSVPEALAMIWGVWEQGRLKGVVPLEARKRYRFSSCRHLSWLGDGRTDYLGPIAAQGRAADVLHAVLTQVEAQDAYGQMIRLADIPEGFAGLSEMKRMELHPSMALSVDESQICLSVELPDNWEDFIAGMGKRSRKDVRYDRRFLDRHFDVEFAVFQTADEMVQAYGDLVSVYQTRRAWEQGLTRYQYRSSAAFEWEVTRRFTEMGKYRIFLIRLNGKPVAVFSGIIHGDCLYGDVFAHDHAYRKYSVGNVMIGHVIEYAIGQGLKTVDLSRGQENYKYKWRGSEKQNVQLMFFKNKSAQRKVQHLEARYQWAIHQSWVDRMTQKAVGFTGRLNAWRMGNPAPYLPSSFKGEEVQ